MLIIDEIVALKKKYENHKDPKVKKDMEWALNEILRQMDAGDWMIKEVTKMRTQKFIAVSTLRDITEITTDDIVRQLAKDAVEAVSKNN